MDKKDIYYVIGPTIAFFVMMYYFFRIKRLKKKGSVAEGEIIDIEQLGDDNYPTIRFNTLVGETVIKKYKVGQSSSTKIGDKVSLYYNPDCPDEFSVKSLGETWIPVIIMIFSVILVIVYFLFFANKK